MNALIAAYAILMCICVATRFLFQCIGEEVSRFLWKLDEPPNLSDYIGRFVKVKDDQGKELVVECERVLGSVRYPHKIQVDSGDKNYLISMLDFFAQMNGENVSQEDIDLFDQTYLEVKGRVPWKKTPSGLLTPNKPSKPS